MDLSIKSLMNTSWQNISSLSPFWLLAPHFFLTHLLSAPVVNPSWQASNPKSNRWRPEVLVCETGYGQGLDKSVDKWAWIMTRVWAELPEVKWMPGLYFRIPKSKNVEHCTGSFYRWSTWKATHRRVYKENKKNVWLYSQPTFTQHHLGQSGEGLRWIILNFYPPRSSQFPGRGRREKQYNVLSSFIDIQIQEDEQCKANCFDIAILNLQK